MLASGLILLCVSLPISAQGKLSHLKPWEGKYPRPEFGKGAGRKPSKNFFALPEINQPLRKLLPKSDYQFLTRTHTKETPIARSGDYLKIFVCALPDSGCYQNTLLVINLIDGAMYVAFDLSAASPRYYSTKGQFTDLPRHLRLP